MWRSTSTVERWSQPGWLSYKSHSGLWRMIGFQSGGADPGHAGHAPWRALHHGSQLITSQALLTHPKTQKRQTTGVQWNSDCFADTHSTSPSRYDGSPKEAYLGDPERVIPNLTSRVEYCYPRGPWPWPVTTTILRVFNGYAPRNWDPTSDPRN